MNEGRKERVDELIYRYLLKIGLQIHVFIDIQCKITNNNNQRMYKNYTSESVHHCYGDKVAQLVRCRTSNQRVAGSIPGLGTLV